MQLRGDGVGLEAIAHKCKNKGCGWERRYTPKWSWLTSIVRHPIYGSLSQKQLVLLDVVNHQCEATAVARLRLKYGG